MAHVPKQKKLTRKEQIERDSMALAQLIYDIWQEKKREEKENDVSQDIG